MQIIKPNSFNKFTCIELTAKWMLLFIPSPSIPCLHLKFKEHLRRKTPLKSHSSSLCIFKSFFKIKCGREDISKEILTPWFYWVDLGFKLERFLQSPMAPKIIIVAKSIFLLLCALWNITTMYITDSKVVTSYLKDWSECYLYRKPGGFWCQCGTITLLEIR